jgi:thioredoxin-dependent peroxiredoxin
MTARASVLYKFERNGDGAMLSVKDKVPDISLEDQDGQEVSLKDFKGKTVVLFFYPRANTPG